MNHDDATEPAKPKRPHPPGWGLAIPVLFRMPPGVIPDSERQRKPLVVVTTTRPRKEAAR